MRGKSFEMLFSSMILMFIIMALRQVRKRLASSKRTELRAEVDQPGTVKRKSGRLVAQRTIELLGPTPWNDRRKKWADSSAFRPEYEVAGCGFFAPRLASFHEKLSY